MTRYMVVCYGYGETWARFFDSYSKAETYRMDAVCGMGYRAQVYEWTEAQGGSYEMIYE